MIEPGMMRQRAVFIRHNGARDSRGGRDAAGWVDLPHSARCQRIDGADTETVQTFGVDAVRVTTLRFYYAFINRMQITTADRIRLGGSTWTIQSIEDEDGVHEVARLVVVDRGVPR